MCCLNCGKENFVLEAESMIMPGLKYLLCSCGMVSMTHPIIGNDIVPTPNDKEGILGFITEEMMKDAAIVLTKAAMEKGLNMPELQFGSIEDDDDYDDEEDCDNCSGRCGDCKDCCTSAYYDEDDDDYDDEEEEENKEDDETVLKDVLSVMSALFGTDNAEALMGQPQPKKEAKTIVLTEAPKANNEERKDYVILEKGGKCWISFSNVTKEELEKELNSILFNDFIIVEAKPVETKEIKTIKIV